MIPRKINTDKPLSFDPADISQKTYAYSIGELAYDLENFLYEHFRGSYSFSRGVPQCAKVYASVDVLALILRKAIECTLGEEIIEINIKSEHGYMLISVSTGKSPIDPDTASNLEELCAKSGATLSFSGNRIVYRSKILKMPIFKLRAGRSRTLYSALVYWFSI